MAKENSVILPVAGFTLYITDFYDFTQEFPASLVLSQIRYWSLPPVNKKGEYLGKSKLKARFPAKTGEFFLARTRAQLGAEIGLSEQQVKRALTCLTSLGLVEVECHVFAGVKCCWARTPLVVLEKDGTFVEELSVLDLMASIRRERGLTEVQDHAIKRYAQKHPQVYLGDLE